MLFIQIRNIPLRGIKMLNGNLVQVANITGRATRGGPLTLPKGFDYENKTLYGFHRVLDSTMKYIGQENAKIIVVEGPIGVGKSACAKILAEQLDMKYIPPPTMDHFYVTPSGYDLRQHDDELPPELRSYDHKNFCRDPKDRRALLFQLRMLYCRFFQYVDAMAHLLNTGQGVILERSYYSDYVFAEAMYEQKYISKEGKAYYDQTVIDSSEHFSSPHLIIYLDIPVDVVQDRIKTRNLSYEQNSPALTKAYLESLDRNWKQNYLKKASKRSEILVYNWTDGGDVDIVIEDIEKVDFDVFRKDDKFREWRIPRKLLFHMRRTFVNDKHDFTHLFFNKTWRVPELYNDPQKVFKHAEILSKLPEFKYDIGYNPLMGDSKLSILFKTKFERKRLLRDYMVVNNGDD